MSALNEIPQPLGKLNEKLAVITGATIGVGLGRSKTFVKQHLMSWRLRGSGDVFKD
jgi:hypothetical protein